MTDGKSITPKESASRRHICRQETVSLQLAAVAEQQAGDDAGRKPDHE